MVEKVRIPQLSANIEEVAVTAWLKQEGASLRKGEPFVELTTDKASIEYEAPCSGILRSVLAQEKSILPVGYIFAMIGKRSDKLPDVSSENETLVARQRTKSVKRRRKKRRPNARRTRVRATPAARRLAKELEVDLSAIELPPDAEVVSESMVRDYAEKTQ